ncbi:hypothetical protein AMATHDRAFT_10053 [Amanita thiersii Skay4041]|uniref:Uncharacterized protein n=1 Tax=Amanita thiersii Skay4041 TaxID=703135 RepID=A0A2A9N819_9AGAR|nr:hypothetical protein AMATHDRAFT_10053 [Amanita thiersii Skay4041]
MPKLEEMVAMMSNPHSTTFITSQSHTFSEPPFINTVHSSCIDATVLSSELGTILDDLPMEVNDIFLETEPSMASNIHDGTSPFHSLALSTTPKSPFVDSDNSSCADPTVVLSELGTIHDDLPMEVNDIFMLEKSLHNIYFIYVLTTTPNTPTPGPTTDPCHHPHP